jgi:hypothetical protein
MGALLLEKTRLCQPVILLLSNGLMQLGARVKLNCPGPSGDLAPFGSPGLRSSKNHRQETVADARCPRRSHRTGPRHHVSGGVVIKKTGAQFLGFRECRRPDKRRVNGGEESAADDDASDDTRELYEMTQVHRRK